MADVALTAVINKTIDIAFNIAMEESRRLYWLKEDIGWIEREMRHLQSYLKDADAKKQGGSEQVANFISDIRDLALDVEDILEEFLPQMASHKKNGLITRFFCRDLITRRNFALEIEKIKRRVADIDRAKTTYGITDSADTVERDTWDPRRPFRHVNEPYVVGFDNHIRVLEAKLLDKAMRFDVVSIVGMPGLGKTTLAKKVFNSTEQRFECSALVYVSQEPNMKQILRDIASQVGLEKDKWEDNVEANLYEFLGGKRYVIMFDDIWKVDAWDALKNSIPVNSDNGSRIILTSRNNEVGRYIGGESSLHELRPLGEDDSRKLFSKMVVALPGNTNEICVPPELEGIGWQIVERCGGVPLAIVVAAGLLRSREGTEQAWRGVLGRMGQDQEDKCSKILALSYKDLALNLRPCFLYFGLFPEDHEISAFELINLWVAEKFIQASGSGDQYLTLEDVGEDNLNKLASRNLIQVVRRRYDGRIGSCRIHDLLHSLCIAVAKESHFFYTCSMLTSNLAMRVRRVTTHRSSISDYINLNLQTPKLRSFLCFHESNILKHKQLQFFCKGFKYMRVLSVKGNAPYRLSIPNEIGNLFHLSYLRLGGIESLELPATIRNLNNLMTLDVRQCEIAYLPTTIWKMKQLRHILLGGDHNDKNNLSYFERKPVDMSPTLPNLQTLVVGASLLSPSWLHQFTSLRKLGISFCKEQCIEILSKEMPISQKLENLRLAFFDCTDIERFNMLHYQNLRKLHLEGDMGKLPRHDRFPPNLNKLTFRKTHLDEESMETLKRLPKLKILKFDSDSYSRETMVCSGANNFPQLEVFQIKDLHGLEELIVEEGGMPTLKKFTVTGCPRLTIPSKRLKRMSTIRHEL